MKTSISNLNGEQQNRLRHLNKALKSALKPLVIICYGHNSRVNFRSSVFSNSGTVKTNHSVFDIFLMISDDEILPDIAVLEIAKRCFAEHIAGNIIVFRMQEVLQGLRNRNRFFSSIFRKGMLLHGNKNIMNSLPGPLSPVPFATCHEKQQLSFLLQHARHSLLNAEQSLSTMVHDVQSTVLLLHESVLFSLRYFITASWGTEIRGDIKELLKCTANTEDGFSRIFPCSTREERVLLDLINLSLLDRGFCPGELMVRTLFKRAAKILELSKRSVQRKMDQLLPA